MLETTKGKDDQNLRIDKLEGVIDTLGATFSSFKFKRKETVGRGPKFMYVPKVSEPNIAPFNELNLLEIHKTLINE